MPESRFVEFGVLNVAAEPHHDPRVYESLLTKVALQPVPFWGPLFGAISPPEQWEPGFIGGTINIWQELDPDKPAIDKATLEEIRLKDSKINVPENMGLNNEHFLYVLRVKDHKFFYENKTEEGYSLAPTRVKKLLDRLFLAINLGGEIGVNITVVPDEDALDKVLAIPKITHLDIFLSPPNADGNEKHSARILKRLADAGAKNQQTIWTAKSRKAGLKLDQGMVADAEVAADNGFVAASGFEKNGARVPLRSTEEYPKIIPYVIPPAGNILAGLIAVARRTVISARRRIKRDD